MSATPITLDHRPKYHVSYGLVRIQRWIRRHELDLWRLGFDTITGAGLALLLITQWVLG